MSAAATMAQQATSPERRTGPASKKDKAAAAAAAAATTTQEAPTAAVEMDDQALAQLEKLVDDETKRKLHAVFGRMDGGAAGTGAASRAATVSKDTKKVVTDSIGAILTAAGDVRGKGKTVDDEKLMATLRQLSESLVEKELDMAMLQTAVERTSERVVSSWSAEMKVGAVFREVLADLGSRRAKDAAKRTATYKRLEKTFAKDDDDVEVEGDESDDKRVLEWKCPYTRDAMKDPMRNKGCGHTINKESLDAILKGANKTCPWAGCRRPIASRNDYEPDEELRMKLETAQRRQAKRRGGAASSSTTTAAAAAASSKRGKKVVDDLDDEE